MARSALLLTLAGGALLFGVGACEKLVGIEDTQVVDSTAGAAPSDNAGASGDSHAGATAQGGDGEAAGAASGGKSGGSAGKAGNANGGASAGTGGSACDCAPADLACNTQCAAGCKCEAPTPICEAGKCIARGPIEALAGSSAANNTFYIDSTEVTNAQYAAFLTAKGTDHSGQRPECGWNDKYEPAKPLGDDKRPVVNVDFCDAAAYCDWAGERLCGALDGGPLLVTDLIDPVKSQWYLACAGPDKQLYPYDGAHVDGYCNEYAAGSALADVGKFTKCEGHYDGVFDLVGNVTEWIDDCDNLGDTRENDTCYPMGGSYNNDANCAEHGPAQRVDTAPSIGFRCCSSK